MTSERVRVFRAEGEYEQERIAVWGGTEWIELEAHAVEVTDGSDGALASIILPCHVGHDLRTPAFAKAARAECVEKFDNAAPRFGADPTVHQLGRDPAADDKLAREFKLPGAVPPPETPAPKLPVWGDQEKRVRFFKITTADGRVFPNHSTDVAGSDAAAAEHVRARWNKLAQGQSGRQAMKVELQDGRVGSDRPDMAPPAGSASAEVEPAENGS